MTSSTTKICSLCYLLLSRCTDISLSYPGNFMITMQRSAGLLPLWFNRTAPNRTRSSPIDPRNKAKTISVFRHIILCHGNLAKGRSTASVHSSLVWICHTMSQSVCCEGRAWPSNWIQAAQRDRPNLGRDSQFVSLPDMIHSRYSLTDMGP